MTRSLLVLCMLTAFSIGGRVDAAAPIPFLDDNETGINMVFSGDPDTTEAGCSPDAPRATTGGAGGKLHNDLLECDNWNFRPRDWGD